MGKEERDEKIEAETAIDSKEVYPNAMGKSRSLIQELRISILIGLTGGLFLETITSGVVRILGRLGYLWPDGPFHGISILYINYFLRPLTLWGYLPFILWYSIPGALLWKFRGTDISARESFLACFVTLFVYIWVFNPMDRRSEVFLSFVLIAGVFAVFMKAFVKLETDRNSKEKRDE